MKIDKVKVKIYFQHVLITVCSSRKSLLSVIAATIDPPASSNGLSFVFNSKLINWEKTEASLPVPASQRLDFSQRLKSFDTG